MERIKHITYATDCSRHAVPALRYAMKISVALGATLQVVRVYNLPPIRTSTIRQPQQLKRSAYKEQMDIVRTYCKKYLKDAFREHAITTDVIEHSSVSDGLLSKARELGSQLLLIGMKDEHSSRDYFSGNIADELLNKSHCPVMILPNSRRYRKIKTLVYATDFEMKDIAAIKSMVALAEPYEAVIRILHVPSTKEYAGLDKMEWFKELLEEEIDYEHIHFHTIFSDNIADGIQMFIRDKNAEILAMLERPDKGFLELIFHKDLVKEMKATVAIPILAYNKKHIN